MKRYMFIFMAIIATLFISACSNNNTQEDINIKELVHQLTIGEHEVDAASITSHQLIIEEDGEEKIYSLPEDEFFVSIAPFKTSTHECAIHSLTTCQGELVEETFRITVETEGGEKLIDEEMETFQNGFIDLWLPRDEEFLVTIQQGDAIAEQRITTFKGDDTCITTMQLISQKE